MRTQRLSSTENGKPVRQRRSIWVLIGLTLLISTPLRAQDLDVPRARARYQQELNQANQARLILDREVAVNSRLTANQNEAQQNARTAQSQLEVARRQLLDIEQNIRSTESKITSLEFDRERATRQREDRSSEIPFLRRKRDDHQLNVTRTDQQIVIIERALSEIDETANPEEAARLRAELTRARQERKTHERSLRLAQLALTQAENDVNQLDSQITQIESNIVTNRNNLARFQSDRFPALSQLDQAERELSRAQDREQIAQNELDRHRPTLAAAQSDWERENREAQTAKRYLDEVIANYNAALQAVLARADEESSRHSQQEAQERAPEAARAQGQADAAKVGNAVGTSEGERRDFSRGYRTGRQTAATTPSLSEAYRDGIRRGQDAANMKAQQEDFPRGYNEALDNLLAKVPDNSLALDITDQISDEPGENGDDLDARKKPINTLPQPDFAFPSEPEYKLPSPQPPSTTTPEPLFRYRNYPCSGLALAEFEPRCRDRYDANYRQVFSAAYGSSYVAVYTSTFNSNVKVHYDTALARTYTEKRNEGARSGAVDQGTLDGFSSSINEARARQYQLGRDAVQKIIATGHLVILRSAQLIEESGDGLFASGDRVKLRLVIDNYGLKSSPRGKFRLRIANKANAETLTFEARELPSLQANTRVTLDGVVAAKISAAPARSKISLEGILELKDSSGNYNEIDRDLADAEIRFPLELQSLNLSGRPRVNQEVSAQLKVTNNTKETITSSDLALTSSPAIVSFIGTPIKVPSLTAGASVDIPITLKPGVWVSDDIPVKILSTVSNLANQNPMTQVFPQLIKLDRNAVLSLKDATGKPVTDGILEATAGKILQFKVQLNFLASSHRPGPFAVRYTKSSHPEIRPANNSTTGVNYGRVGPGTVLTPISFAFNIPASLRGTDGYILIQLNDGSVATHALQIQLRIR